MLHGIKNLDDASETKEGLEQGADFLKDKIREIEEIVSEIREGTGTGGTAEEWSSYCIETICEDGDTFIGGLETYVEELEDLIEKADESVDYWSGKEEEDACSE